MERYRLVRHIIEKLYEDGEAHTLEEMRVRCQEEGIDVKADRNIVNNVVYRMREQGYLYRGEEKGSYLPGLPVKEWERHWEAVGAERGIQREPGSPCNSEHYFVLKPPKAQGQVPKLCILEQGEIKLNAALRRQLPDRKIRILMGRDYRTLVLEPDGKDAHVFTKAGVAKNTQIVELLRKAKLTFPVVYLLSWNEKIQKWEGKIQVDKKT